MLEKEMEKYKENNKYFFASNLRAIVKCDYCGTPCCI